ncbi:MAG: hypothetical protein KFB93_05980 [Simkaniaceae bacterium]|nr:MAG: hypothetical protein KFB93_05980 [Simkaniaceae bacterium]
MAILTLGPQGSFSHEAAVKLHSHKKVLFASNIDELFFRLAEKEISEGIIPLEIGDEFVEESIAHLMKYDFSITRKAILRMRYHLISEEETITHLFGDDLGFEGCRAKIHEFCSDAKKITASSMVHAAIQYKAQPKEAGAIISPFAARHYKLPIYAEDIEDDNENFATFFSIGKFPPKKKEKRGTAFLIFSDPMVTVAKQIADQAHERKIPLIKLKNLLLQEGHTPLYFMEVEGHIEDRLVRSFFESLSEKYLIKHLGSYPL